mmetsp:Transcript_11059/g.24393  ORF Transcript_11059/g.24393 Transcript_11059/m.24393 type:complete len:209 (+) Transcript_11059:205-831(+)
MNEYHTNTFERSSKNRHAKISKYAFASIVACRVRQRASSELIKPRLSSVDNRPPSSSQYDWSIKLDISGMNNDVVTTPRIYTSTYCHEVMISIVENIFVCKQIFIGTNHTTITSIIKANGTTIHVPRKTIINRTKPNFSQTLPISLTKSASALVTLNILYRANELPASPASDITPTRPNICTLKEGRKNPIMKRENVKKPIREKLNLT